MVDETAIVSIGFDASKAKKGAEEFKAAGQDVINTNKAVEASETAAAAKVEAAEGRKTAARKTAAAAAKTAATDEATATKGAAADVENATSRVVTSLSSQNRVLAAAAREFDPFGVAARKAAKQLAELQTIAAGSGPKAEEAARYVAQAAAKLRDLERLAATSMANAPGLSGAVAQVAQANVQWGATLGLARQLVPALGAVYATDQVRAFAMFVAKAGSEWLSLTARVGQAGVSIDKVYGIAQRTGTSLADTAGGVQRLGMAAKEIGATGADLAQVTENVLKLGVVGNASAQELSSGLTQLGQALASGRLGGDELRAIMESMPTLAKAIADGLGVSVGRLREMGAAGMLTADKVFPAILAASKSADEQFARMPMTVDRAGIRMENAFARAGAAIDRSTGLSKLLAQGINAVAAAADGLADVLEGGLKREIAAIRAELDALRQTPAETSASRGSAMGVSPGLVDRKRAERIAFLELQYDLKTYQDFEQEFAAANNELWERTAGKQIAATKKMNDGIADLHKGLGFVVVDGRLMTAEQALLERATLAVNAAIERGGAGLKLLGGEANAAQAMLEQLRAKIDPVTAAIKSMNDEAALLKVPEGFARDVEAARQALLKQPGVTPAQLGGVPGAVSDRNTARVEDQARQTQAEAVAQERLAKAAGGSSAAMREAQRVNALVAQGLRLDLTPEQRKFLVETGKVPAGVTPALESLRALDAAGRSKWAAEGKQEVAEWSASMSVAVNSARLMADAAGQGEAAQRAAAAAAAIYAEKNNKAGEATKQRALEQAAVLNITNETVRTLERETEANTLMAAAILQGTEAVEAETRAQYQRAMVLRLGTGNVKELTAAMEAYDAREASKKVTSAATLLKDTQDQIKAADAMTAAILAGSDAVAEQKVQQELLAKANKLNIDSVEKFVRLYPTEAAAARSLTEALQRQAAAQLLVTQRRDIAVGQAELAMANLLPEVRQREIALLRTKLEIMDRIPESEAKARAEALRNADVLAAINDQLRVRNEIEAKGKEIGNDVTQFLVDGFVNVENKGKSVFKNLWDAALAGGRRFLANLAAEALIKPIVVPIATPIVGAAAVFGITVNDNIPAAEEAA